MCFTHLHANIETNAGTQCFEQSIWDFNNFQHWTVFTGFCRPIFDFLGGIRKSFGVLDFEMPIFYAFNLCVAI